MVKRLLFILPILFLIAFVLFFSKPQITCADDGGCTASGAICYTGTKGADFAPGFQCGTEKNYAYDDVTKNKGSEQPENGIPSCRLSGQFTDGYCCVPGNPKPSLPPHKGYDLGPPCSQTSICYTGDHKDPTAPGANCGNLDGWHVGNDGSGGTAYCGINRSICCDVGGPSFTPVPPNPCPNAPTPGVCMSVDTAVGTIDVSGPGGFIKTAFGVLLSISGGVAILLIIFSGYRIMAAQGDSEKLKGAQEMLTSAIIGLLFMIFSVAILHIIGVDILHIPGFK